MAKRNTGGKRAASATRTQSTPTPQAPPAPQVAPQQNDVQNNISVEDNNAPTQNNYNEFLKMPIDQRVAQMEQAAKQDVPLFLSTSMLQRIAYNLNVNDVPQAIDAAEFDKIGGQTFYRTVNSVYDRKNDINWTPSDIAGQIMYGNSTMYSGTSAYGQGIYFADNYSDSADYGNISHNINKTAIMRMKFSKNVNLTTKQYISKQIGSEITKGTKLGKLLNKCNSKEQYGVYCIAKGIDAYNTQMGYYVIINRRNCVFDDEIRATKSRGGW